MSNTTTIAGRYRIDAVNAETGAVRELAPWFDNLILDAGLNRIGIGGVTGLCSVGSGATAPVETDTGLVSTVASTSTINTQSTGTQGSAPYFGWFRQTYRFAAGAAAGNLAEVGVGWTVGSLFSRSLIKDTNGNPTTITVLSNEFLDVTYELRIYPPASDATFTCVVGGVTHNCVLRAADVTYLYSWYPDIRTSAATFGNVAAGGSQAVRIYNGPLGTTVQRPSGTGAYATAVAKNAYANNSYTITGTATFDLNTGNLAGGVTSMVIDSVIGTYQCSFSPAIDKTASKTMALNFSITWARKSI